VGSRLEPRPPQQRRLADAIAGTDAAPDASEQPLHDRERLALDVALSASSNERLKRMDFESMSAEEYRAAERLAERLPVLVEPVATRRQAAAARGELDLRGVLRRSARDPYGALPPRRRRRERLPPLVVLCDVSGSMQRYSRMFLHWAHALRVHHPAIETLTLGTRLTRITRALALRDPDAAMKAAGDEVSDWAGGTRLGECLRDFNRHWARRLLNARAEVLLLTDGLERDDVSLLSVQARRLRSFAARLIWLNPLLRFDGFEPRAAGIQALLPHVDEFLPAHNLNSLADLARRLADAQRDRRNPMERHRWK
ncbi:MAG TPA: VWA domain-containing protein, partial [Burkholderiaceae bacterium]|nr:VWA domain-containing protein [Burkholderiaceae bacterium]